MSQEARTRVAYNVKYYRKLKSYKCEQMSLILGFDNSYISKLEKGRINITIDRLEKIANLLEVDINIWVRNYLRKLE